MAQDWNFTCLIGRLDFMSFWYPGDTWLLKLAGGSGQRDVSSSASNTSQKCVFLHVTVVKTETLILLHNISWLYKGIFMDLNSGLFFIEMRKV